MTESTPITSEAESARDFDWSTQRSWKVINPNRVNKHGTNVGYKLVPGACFPPMMDEFSPQYLRAPVIGHTLWVTKNSSDERWPAGAYPASETDAGMTEWIKDDAPLVNTDVVLWYVFGIHHITRMEEADHVGRHGVVLALPTGFFDRNPSIDAPPTPKAGGGLPQRLTRPRGRYSTMVGVSLCRVSAEECRLCRAPHHHQDQAEDDQSESQYENQADTEKACSAAVFG